MNTSYFSKSSNHHLAVSIALWSPVWFTGKFYRKLAPTPDILRKYKQDGDTAAYIEAYNNEVLSKLDPREVYNELGEDAVLLCYEAQGKFCHRHIVAKWFKEKLDIEVSEIP